MEGNTRSVNEIASLVEGRGRSGEEIKAKALCLGQIWALYTPPRASILVDRAA